MLLRVFEEEHQEQVNHCQFTNTKRQVLLATCSDDNFLNVKVSECVSSFYKHMTFPPLCWLSPYFNISFGINCTKIIQNLNIYMQK